MKKGGRHSTYIKGSFTVEAAVLIPLILFIIFTFIYVAFFLHDYCVLHAVSGQVVSELCHVKEQGGTFYDGESEKDEDQFKMNEKIEKELERKLLLYSYYDSDSSISLQRVIVRLRAEANMPFYLQSFHLFPTEVEVKAEGNIYDPTTSVRAGDIILKEIKKTKIFDKAQDMFQKVKAYIF